jgi:hypothetical protein
MATKRPNRPRRPSPQRAATTSVRPPAVNLDQQDRVDAIAVRRTGKRGFQWQQWSRWLHVYTSMISLLLVLFFGLTGITLNHPTWTLGSGPSTRTVTGTLPAGFDANGTVDFLAVSEYVRNHDGVTGHVADYSATDSAGQIAYKAAGYAADLQFDIASGNYTLRVSEQGFLAVMNDIHKGRDTDSSWSWVIDLAGGLLVVVAVTGLGIQLFMRKRRVLALSLAGGALVVSVLLMYVAV